ncbi:DHH family phosphoesterase [Jutongia hominis]|uniref:Cyclic-di-AMP phosphodiesterase n=1 Tax=Jutongia hominis TaxID=2763664 RepID=A0ABR7MS23_9FIRM|nr:DHH family phosphoesterase [Jutongia hominis]MBC8556606.1 DHH family phosphoesterase [Jutongia hominis]
MKRGLKLKGMLRLYLKWPLFLSILFIIMDIQLFVINRRIGVIGAVYCVIFILITLILNFFGKKGIRRDLVQFAENYGKMQMNMIKEMDIPYAVLSEEGQLLWGNDKFLQVIVNKKAARRSITNIFPEITQNILPKLPEPKEAHVQAGERYYRCVMNLIVDSGSSVGGEEELAFDQMLDTKRIIAMCLYEETEVINLEKVREAENLVVGLLYIDNYDELIDSIDEVRQALTMALIDRKVNKYMQSIDAISKKLEKDKFFFAFKQKYLDGLMSSRFSILEEIRNINLGNDQSATISIGIGVGKGTYMERYEWARGAMDLALGRGGDQAVVKNGEKEQFFGGKRVQIERNTRVKARVKAHVLKELIEGKERVVVMGHSIGDVDSFGACVGIYRIAKTLNRKAHIVVDEVNSSVKPIMERFYSKDYESDLLIDGEEAKELVDESTLLVIVDVNKGSYTECPDLIDMAQSVVVIDHHRQAGDAITKALLFYIEPYASSACEMVAEISQYIGNGLRLRPAEAEAMYAGIMIDTNYFTDKAGVRTFEAMAYLRRSGADVVRVRKLFREDINEYKIKAAAIQDTELYLGEYAIAESLAEGVESPTVLGAKIANSLLDINGVKASFVLTKYNGKIYISARSIDELNVQVMMERLGGGGHINMAGAQLKDMSMEEAKAIIRETIDNMITEGEA